MEDLTEMRPGDETPVQDHVCTAVIEDMVESTPDDAWEGIEA